MKESLLTDSVIWEVIGYTLSSEKGHAGHDMTTKTLWGEVEKCWGTCGIWTFIFSDISGWPKSSFRFFCKVLPKSWTNFLANPIINWGHLLRLGKVSLILQAWRVRKGWCLPDERNESSVIGKQQIDESAEIPWLLGSPKFDMVVIHRMLSVCWKSRRFRCYKTKFQAQQSKECPGSPYSWALCCSFVWHSLRKPLFLFFLSYLIWCMHHF